MTDDAVPVAERVAAVVVTLVLASCSHSTPRAGVVGSKATVPRATVLVALGSGATFGVGLTRPLSDAWPQLLYHEAFPRSAVLVNASEKFVTVGTAIAQQVPVALEAHATVAAVWLGDADVDDGVPVATFEAQLDRLVGRLRAAGSQVLIGNLPLAGDPLFAAYNRAIARVALAQGATLVDLASALSATPKIEPSVIIDPAASRAVARAFAAAAGGSA